MSLIKRSAKAVLAMVAVSVLALPVKAENDPCSRAYAISAAILTLRQHDIPLPRVLETTNALVNVLSEDQRADVETTLRSIIVDVYQKSKNEAALISADEFGNSYGLNCLTGEDKRFLEIIWDQQTIDAFSEWAEVLLTADKQQGNALDSEKQSATVLDTLTTRITRAWRRPVAYRGGLEVYLRMSLASNGELVDVRIVKTSGDVLFDRSAVTAVKRAAPFDEVKQFDEATFEEKFRSLTVKFRPED